MLRNILIVAAAATASAGTASIPVPEATTMLSRPRLKKQGRAGVGASGKNSEASARAAEAPSASAVGAASSLGSTAVSRLEVLRKDMQIRVLGERASFVQRLNAQQQENSDAASKNAELIVSIEDLKHKIMYLQNRTSAVRKDIDELGGVVRELEKAPSHQTHSLLAVNTETHPAVARSLISKGANLQRTKQTSKKLDARLSVGAAQHTALLKEQVELNETKAVLQELHDLPAKFEQEFAVGTQAKKKLMKEQAALEAVKSSLMELQNGIAVKLMDLIKQRKDLRLKAGFAN